MAISFCPQVQNIGRMYCRKKSKIGEKYNTQDRFVFQFVRGNLKLWHDLVKNLERYLLKNDVGVGMLTVL